MPQTLLITHNDMDGMGCVYALRKHTPDFATIVLNSGDKFPVVAGYDMVYVTDFTTSRLDYNALATNNKMVAIIDHHDGSSWIVDEQVNGLWGRTNSGAVLMWKYLFGDDAKIPTVLEYIQDRDLYTNKLPYTREVAAYMKCTIKNPDAIEKALDDIEEAGILSIAAIGERLLKQTDTYAKAIASQVEIVKRAGYHQPSYGIVRSPILASEVGERVLRDTLVDFAVIWSVKQPSKPEEWASILVELRAVTRNGRIYPITDLAKLAGGGGHTNHGAAGFKITNSTTVNSILATGMVGYMDSLMDQLSSNIGIKRNARY